LFWSLAAMSHALCRSVPGFSAARFALGLGESGNYPTAIRVVTEWFPPKERSVATGIFNTGSNMGAIFAPVLVPFIVAYFGGWQAAFVTLGCVDLVWLALWLGFYDAPEKSKRVNVAELAHIHGGVTPAAEEKIPWLKLLRYREAWAYYGTCVLVGPVWWFYGFWLPDFFNKQFHLDLKHFGPPLVVIYAVTALGSIGGGGLSAWFLKRGWSLNRARKTATFLFACCTLPVIFAPRVGNVWLATAFFALAAAAHQGWSATMYTAVADIFPKRAVASVVGFGGTLASLTSMGFFYLVGHVLQGEGTYSSILLVCGSAYVVAWAIFHLGVPQIKPATIKESIA
jgi:ACS family hexuronate transporter-like MFS transporter